MELDGGMTMQTEGTNNSAPLENVSRFLWQSSLSGAPHYTRYLAPPFS